MARNKRYSLTFLLIATFLLSIAEAQSMPSEVPGARISVEARDSVVDRAALIATCNTSECQGNDDEGSTADESFCDTSPAIVPGAEGSCPAPATTAGDAPPELGSHEAFGCARFAVDRVLPFSWSMDDPQKLCVLRTCAGDQPCFEGHRGSPSNELWAQGATLELPSSSPVTISAGADFHLWTVIRIAPPAARECLLGSARHHLCVEPDGSLFLRLDTWSASLTEAAGVPLGAWISLEVSRSAGALRVWIDGQEATFGSPSNSDKSFIVSYLMSSFKGDDAFVGQMAATWLYDRVLDGSERADMHQYLADLYDVGPSSSLGRLGIDSPTDKYVAQRRYDAAGGQWQADFSISGTFDGPTTAVEARVVEAETLAPVTPWTTVDPTPSAGSWSGLLPSVPQGGWYRVEARKVDRPQAAALAGNRFGVGMVIAAIGQSNMVKMFTEDEGDGSVPLPFETAHELTHRLGYGEPADFTYSRPRNEDIPVTWGPVTGSGGIRLANNLVEAVGVPVLMLDFALDWTGLLQHWNNPTGFAGWTRFAAALEAVSGLEAVIWHQGAFDAHEAAGYDNDVVTPDEHMAGLDSLYSRITDLRPETAYGGPLPFVLALQNRGVYDDVITKDDAYNAVRRAQLRWADERAHGFLAGSTVDLDLSHRPTTGSGHFWASDYQEMADRYSRALLHAIGQPGWQLGAEGGRLSTVEIQGKTLQIHVDHDHGNRLRLGDPGSPVEGFTVTDGAWVEDVGNGPQRRQLEIVSARLSDSEPGNWVQLELAQAPTDPVSIRYLYGQNVFHDKATDTERRRNGNTLYDDFAYFEGRDGLPIQPTTQDLAALPVGEMLVSTDGVSVAEGDSATFIVSLGSVPAQDVWVHVEVEGDDDLELVDPSPLILTAENALAGRAVSITALPDADAESGSAVIRLRADGYLSRVVQAFEIDSDPFLDVIGGDGLAVSELDGEAQFQVALGVPPSSPVRLTIHSDDPARLQVIPSELLFTSASWNLPQTIRVIGHVTELSSASRVDVVLAVDDAASDDLYDPLPDLHLPTTLLHLETGLQLFWSLDTCQPDGSGRLTPDTSGFERHGIVGDRARTDLIGAQDGALGTSGPGSADGDFEDGISTPPFPIDEGRELTVLLWYRPGADKHDGYLFHWGGTYHDVNAMSAFLDVGEGLRIRVHDTTDESSVLQVTPTGFDHIGWHHLALVKDETGSKVYFDGSLVGSHGMGSGTLAPTDGFALGMNEIGTYGTVADFDDVRIYDRALTEEEIQTLFTIAADTPVSIELSPEPAAGQGQWAVPAFEENPGDPEGQPIWHPSGDTVELPPGSWTVTFSEVPGLLTPIDLTIEVELGEPLLRQQSYAATGQGRVRGLITPAFEDIGGRWYLSTEDPIDARPSGEEVLLPEGSYSVRFTPVADWIEPPDVSLTVTENMTAVASGNYLRPEHIDPILHLRLDETSGGVAFDSSGHGRHGLLGTRTLLDQPGIEGTAITAGGSGGPAGDLDDGVQVPDLAPDDSYAETTVAFWYRLQAGGDGYLFHWGGSYHDPDSISIYVDRGKELRIRVHDSQDTTSTLATAPASAHGDFDDLGWHHLAVVKSFAGTEVFFDGASVAGHPMGTGPFAPRLGLGLGTNESGSYGTSATFDELLVWERPLADGEIASLFQASAIGRLSVLLQPEEVRGDATWRLDTDADTVQRTHGELLTLGPGPATVIFAPVSDRASPEPQTVDVRLGQTVTVTGDYNAPAPSPIVHLPLDDTADDAVGGQATDISGQGRHGTLGSRMMVDLDGVDGRAVQTAGVGGGSGTLEDGLQIPFTLSRPLYELTVAFWYRLPPTAHNGYLFAWGGSYTDDHAVSAYVDVGSELRVRVRDSGDHSSEVPVGVIGFDDAAWHHLAIVKDTDGASIYLDGSLVAQSSSGAGGILPGAGFYLGSNEVGRHGIEATFDDLRIYQEALNAAEVAELATGFVVPDGFGGAYLTVDELRQELLQLAGVHGQTLEIVDFGDSWAKSVGGWTTEDGDELPGDDLLAARITRLDTLDPGVQRPVFVLASCLHAREIATPELAMRLVRHLLDGYDLDADITWLVDHHEVWILPMVNPDGHRMVELGALSFHGSRPWHWRKNVRPTATCPWPPTDAHTFGVDLNRNFPFQWGLLDGVGGAGDACDSHHRGAEAGSEPETQALMSLLSSLIPDQRAEPETAADPGTIGIFIQLHSPFRTVAWPWASSALPSPELAGLSAIGHKLASLNGYDAGQAPDVIYAMSGTADDWVHGELGAAALLLEVGEGLMPAFNRVDNVIWPENRDALLYAAKIARTPYETALGPDVGPISVSTAGTETVTVSTTADDSTNGGDDIAEIELYVDDPPWVAGALSMAILVADDGSFDSPTENVSGALDISDWSTGRHTVYVRARDAAGHWGPVSASFVWVD